MKIFINAHAITAVLAWVLAIFSGAGVLSEGGLAAAGTLFIMAITTFITIVDILAIYFAKKQKTDIFSVISIVFWALIYIVYIKALFSSNSLFKAPLMYVSISVVAIFKIIVSAFMIKFKEEML